jgi:hypothetical protein
VCVSLFCVIVTGSTGSRARHHVTSWSVPIYTPRIELSVCVCCGSWCDFSCVFITAVPIYKAVHTFVFIFTGVFFVFIQFTTCGRNFGKHVDSLTIFSLKKKPCKHTHPQMLKCTSNSPTAENGSKSFVPANVPPPLPEEAMATTAAPKKVTIIGRSSRLRPSSLALRSLALDGVGTNSKPVPLWSGSDTRCRTCVSRDSQHTYGWQGAATGVPRWPKSLAITV